MKRFTTLAVLCATACTLAATAGAQPPRQDAIWARSTGGAPLVLMGSSTSPSGRSPKRR